MARLAPLWIVALIAAGACGSVPPAGPAGESTTPSAPESAGVNVTGKLDRAGSSPTCPAGEPCDPHIVAYRLVFSSQGQTDVAVRVGGDGSFALHLDPGVYAIAAEPPSFQAHIEPSEVTVPKQGTVYLHLQFRAA